MNNEKIRLLVEDLHRRVTNLYDSSQFGEYDEAHKQIKGVEEAFTKAKIALCPHPAFAAGRCVLCKGTYTETGV